MTEKKWIKIHSRMYSISSYREERVHCFIDEFDAAKSAFDLNDIVQLHNILKYLKLAGTKINEKETAFQGTARKIVGCYFAERGLGDLDEEYASLYGPYKEDFWEIFVDYKVIKKTSVMQFQEFAEQNKIYVGNFLTQKAICDKYKIAVKAMLLKEPRHFELFLKKYDSATAVSYEFPSGFTSPEISEWASRYCELPDANTNYLQQLSRWSPKHEYKIDDKVLIKARRASESIMSTYLVEGRGHSWGISVNIKPDVPGGYAYRLSDDKILQLDLDKNLLDNVKEYSSLLQNFISVFGFFDEYGRFALVNSPIKSESLLDMFNPGSKFAYKETLDFDIKRSSGKLRFLAYYDYLAHRDIDLEELFAYCYRELFADEYKIDQFFFHSSPKENNYYTRSKALLPELDSVLKQFDMYQEDGEIDLDLFELKSTSNGYRSIKSLSERKFVYINSNKIDGLLELLFGHQSPLACPEKKEVMDSFYEHVRNGVRLDDFDVVQQRIISESIMAKGIVDCDDKNLLYFKDLTLITLYGIIRACGYCSLMGFGDDLLQLLDREVKKGNLEYGGTLFSKQESDYISFIMDNKKFNNALAIRNKITHGSFAKKSSKEHKEYYLELLMILMMYTIRINDELEHQYIRRNPESHQAVDLTVESP